MAVQTSLFDVSGQVALVTGGGSGIGLAIARALAEHGAQVLVGSRTKEKVEDAAKQICDAAGRADAARAVALDVADEQSVADAVAATTDAFGRLDVLVNSAGVMLRKPTLELTREDFNQLHEIHVTGSLSACQHAAKVMTDQGGGCLINLASISSFVDLVEVAAYAAAKNAILGLTRSLANEWAKHGIRTNAIAPGFIPTDFNRKMIENTDRGRRILEHTPMARFGSADEIAGAAVYLASPAGRFVNGHTIVVDGGYLASGIGDSFAPWADPSC